MDLMQAHGSGLRRFDERVHQIHPTQWGSATPDTDWTVRDLVNHLVGEQLWVPDLLGGASIAEIGDRYDGDVLGDDPVAAWSAASIAARAAWTAPGATERTVQLSTGPSPATEYLRQMTFDLVVHSWDLARAIGAPEDMPNDLVHFVLEDMRGEIARWQGSGMFAPPLDTAACTDDLTELLALTGRKR
ncbi:TIGR03086 family protein [Nakamurella sp. YIM 132087]|uniref:TIGR03086 family protein n=1 Tax=Nakamurella alba TaxID=2665158 RepID=A0A7K1FNK6_9ACTN|nr:TIGR03086 family metal-binding protein [Nakamurella alba]MTD15718.1 TIGR03086 family protein [Nakamurella alba]